MIHRWLSLLSLTLLLGSCTHHTSTEEAAEFLNTFTHRYQQLYYEAAEAAWMANTDISPAHDSISVAGEKRLSAFVGSPEVIAQVRTLLSARKDLDTLQVMQLEKILLNAAHSPGTIAEVVDSLIEEGVTQTSILYGHRFVMTGGDGVTKEVSTNDIDKILVQSKDVRERRAAWETSKEVGTDLKEGLARLQHLRNAVAREMGYSSFFDLEVAEYGLSTPEMMALMDSLVVQLRPLYSELYTYARYELARRYRQPVPERIPADWLPNRWGQNWPGIVNAVNLDDLFAGQSAEWIVRQAEHFYTSLGFPSLKENFWMKSDLYPVDPGSSRRKNNHASAWHLDLKDDYRSLMSVVPDSRWFGTAHHELGHIYYYIEYSNPDVPLLLRRGANRSYHEGIGDLMKIAALQRPYLEQLNLLTRDTKIDQIQWLLNDAFSNSSAVFIPFAAGTMAHFEHDLYENDLPKNQFNARWWEYVGEFQGIVPPSERGEEFCDAATKTHIIDDPAQYYDYALSCVLKFHLHDYVARNILHEDPRACNYYGHPEVGEFLRGIMRPGASRNWRAVLKEKTGEDLSARAMLSYYEPLMQYLRELNKGRKKTF
jgi:peptidyl-dipeptidase A